MLHILDDKTKFSRVKSDNNLSNLSRFQRFLRRLKSKKLLEEDDYRRIYPSATSLPAMYGLPKIHKPTVPLRPTLSATGSYNQECAKLLSQNLGFLREHPTNLKDSFTFVNNMKDKFLHNKQMVSFDVISLFTNIPVHYTINLILDKLFDDDTDRRARQHCFWLSAFISRPQVRNIHLPGRIILFESLIPSGKYCIS